MKEKNLYLDMVFTSIVVSVIYSFFAGFLQNYIDMNSSRIDEEFAINVIIYFFSIALITIFIIAPANYYISKIGKIKGPVLLSIGAGSIVLILSISTNDYTPMLFLFLTPLFSLISTLFRRVLGA